MARAVDEWANGHVPRVSRRANKRTVTLHVITTRHSDERGVEVGQSIHEVNPHTVRLVVISRWEERDEVEVQRTSSSLRAIERNEQGVVRVRSSSRRLKRVGDMSPAIRGGSGRDGGGGEDLTGDVGDQTGNEVAAVGATNVKLALVLVGLHVDAPESRVFEGHGAGAGHIHADGQSGGKWVGLLESERGAATRVEWCNCRSGDVVGLEGTIHDEFGVL